MLEVSYEGSPCSLQYVNIFFRVFDLAACGWDAYVVGNVCDNSYTSIVMTVS